MLRHLASGLWAALCTWLLLQVVIGAYVTIWPQSASDIVSLGLLHALVLGGAVFVVGSPLLARPEGTELGPRLLVWQRVTALSDPRAHALGLGALAGVFAKVPADALRGAVELRFPTDELELVQQWNLLKHETWWQAALLFVVIGLTGPLLEEVFYRGVLFERLSRGIGLWGAWLVSSVVFAVSHPSPRDWPSLLLVGLVLGDLRRVGGSIWPSLGAHIAFNCSTLLAVVWGAQSQTDDYGFQWWLVVGASVLLGALLILVRRLL